MDEKRRLVDSALATISRRKKAYEKKMIRFKRIDDICEAVVISSSTIAASTLFTTIALLNPAPLIVGASLTSISALVSAVKRAVNITHKYESSKTTYTQYSELERDIRTTLVRNHLDSQALQILLQDTNNRLALIEDSSLPINISD